MHTIIIVIITITHPIPRRNDTDTTLPSAHTFPSLLLSSNTRIYLGDMIRLNKSVTLSNLVTFDIFNVDCGPITTLPVHPKHSSIYIDLTKLVYINMVPIHSFSRFTSITKYEMRRKFPTQHLNPITKVISLLHIAICKFSMSSP
jgi:hypothetical protein